MLHSTRASECSGLSRFAGQPKQLGSAIRFSFLLREVEYKYEHGKTKTPHLDSGLSQRGINFADKHQFVDGVVYVMAGATANHNRIATNATGALYSHLRGKRCQAFDSDMKIRVRLGCSTRFYYPDLSVVCRPNAGDDTFQDNPVVIVEVISESTRRVDEYEKREAYLSINSLCVYVLLEPNTTAALVYRRADEGFKCQTYEGPDAIIPVPEIECDLSLAEVSAQVEFLPSDPDM